MLGIGVFKSMAVTFWNFLLTYINPKQGVTTIQYPEARRESAERFRNFPFLIFDESPDNMRCVACDICAKECPPKCIYIVPHKDENGKVVKKPAQFDIDYAICMNCGICEEVCPFDAIFMDHEYELGEQNREDSLMYDIDRLLKPAEHFAKIRPTDHGIIQAKRDKKGAKGRSAAPAATPATPASAAPAQATATETKPEPKPAEATPPKQDS